MDQQQPRLHAFIRITDAADGRQATDRRRLSPLTEGTHHGPFGQKILIIPVVLQITSRGALGRLSAGRASWKMAVSVFVCHRCPDDGVTDTQ